MNQLADPAPARSRATQHGLLVAFGHFAREIGLPEQLQQVSAPQKTVTRRPSAKLTTLFLGLLTGIEYLTDLTYAPAPL
ncbi:MAG TPA: hypothetical protein VFM49_07570 [Chloroflexia bacterium]|jgi:hypothetical protein|nr:hypothetical protein [Chloroflexia bacterium]